MAVKLVFEDGEDTPSSILLKQSCHGENINFSNGVSQLLEKAVSIKDSDDIVYMFYDVSPNNERTVKGYEMLVDTLKQNKELYKNMYVVPIICMEYCICKTLERYGWFWTNSAKESEMIEKLIIAFDWNGVSDEIKSDVYVGVSLEHAYKSIVANLRLRCLHNSFEYTGASKVRKAQSLSGMFYEKDCKCERKYCPIDCRDKLEVKAEKLYCSLPVFPVETDEHKKILSKLGINTKKMSKEDIKMERRLFYKKICDNMHLPLFSIEM